MRRLLIFLTAPLLLSACGGDAAQPELGEGEYPTVTTERGDAYHEALLEGELGAEESDGVVYFSVELEGADYGLILPDGFVALEGDEGWQLFDRQEDRLVATEGERVGVGGAAGFPGGKRLWGDGPDVDDFWGASPDIDALS